MNNRSFLIKPSSRFIPLSKILNLKELLENEIFGYKYSFDRGGELSGKVFLKKFYKPFQLFQTVSVIISNYLSIARTM